VLASEVPEKTLKGECSSAGGWNDSYTTNLHDITSGSNGYSATTGYDLATGWGSPNEAAWSMRSRWNDRLRP